MGFEERLWEALPRGVPGKEEEVVTSGYLDRNELKGPRWAYQRGHSVLLGYHSGKGVSFLQPDGNGGHRPDDRHICTIAGSRAGKGVSLIVPNLLLYDQGSVVAIDPKGELARITTRARRKMGQEVFILDPFGTNGRYPSHSYNPLSMLDPASEAAIDDAALIADGLIEHPETDRHWTETAQSIVQALILFVLTLDADERHLGTVRDLLTLSDPSVQRLAKNGQPAVKALIEMLKSVDPNVPYAPVVIGVAEQLSDMGEKELGSVLSAGRTQTQWLDSPAIRECLKDHPERMLKLSDLKGGFMGRKATVFLCLPASRLATHARWMRVIINQAIGAMERLGTGSQGQVLFVLDEAFLLGNMRSIEVAAGFMSGYGVKLWTIVQDLSQLKKNYKSTWETFLGNAGVVTCFGNTDPTTLDYISKRCGAMGLRVVVPTAASMSARLSGAPDSQEQLQVTPLLSPHEVERVLAREEERIMVLAAGQKPVILKRAKYYADPPFEGLFDA